MSGYIFNYGNLFGIFIFALVIYFVFFFPWFEFLKKKVDILHLINMSGGLNNKNLDAWFLATGYSYYEEFYKVRLFNNVFQVTQLSKKEFVEYWLSNSIEKVIEVEGCVYFDEENGIDTELIYEYEDDTKYKQKLELEFESVNKKNVNYIIAALSENSVFEDE